MRKFKPMTRQEPVVDTYHRVIGHHTVEVRDTYHRVIMIEDCDCVAPKVCRTTFERMTFYCPVHEALEADGKKLAAEQAA